MKVESEPDRIDRRFVMGIAVVALVSTGVCCLLAWLVLRGAVSSSRLAEARQLRGTATPALAGTLENDLFAEQAPDLAASKTPGQLRSFGWSQRERGLVHIPIDRAFELYVAGARARTGTAVPPEQRP